MNSKDFARPTDSTPIIVSVRRMSNHLLYTGTTEHALSKFLTEFCTHSSTHIHIHTKTVRPLSRDPSNSVFTLLHESQKFSPAVYSVTFMQHDLRRKRKRKTASVCASVFSVHVHFGKLYLIFARIRSQQRIYKQQHFCVYIVSNGALVLHLSRTGCLNASWKPKWAHSKRWFVRPAMYISLVVVIQENVAWKSGCQCSVVVERREASKSVLLRRVVCAKVSCDSKQIDKVIAEITRHFYSFKHVFVHLKKKLVQRINHILFTESHWIVSN